MADAPPPTSDRQSERAFAVFAFAWALSAIVNTSARLDPDADRLLFFAKSATIACAALVLARPSSLARFVALALVHAATLWGEMPNVNNHGTLVFVLQVAALAVFATSRRFDGDGSAAFYAAFAPIARMSLLVLYVWTTVHKLNWGFVDLDLSCASSELAKLREHTVFGVSLAFLPGNRAAEFVSIWGTLMVEGAIPVLLAFRRTRLAGVWLAALFHYLLGFSYPGFSAMLYAVLTLFLATSTWDALRLGAASNASRFVRLLRSGLELSALMWIAFAVITAFSEDAGPVSPEPDAFRSFWLVYGVLGLGVLAFVSRRALIVRDPEPARAQRIVPRPILLPFVALVFANGLSPYVGLKTTLCYAMFSNLRTEGGRSNHMIIPEALLVFDVERDLVSIHSSSDAALHALSVPSWSGAPNNETFVAFFRPTEAQKLGLPPAWKLPYQALRQRVTFLAEHGATNVALVFERGGVVHRSTNAERDPELASFPYLASKLLRLRAVPDVDEGCCLW